MASRRVGQAAAAAVRGSLKPSRPKYTTPQGRLSATEGLAARNPGALVGQPDIRAAILAQVTQAAGVGATTPAELQIAQESLQQFPGGGPGLSVTVPRAPVPGNQYAGVANAVSRFQKQSAARQAASDRGLPRGDMLDQYSGSIGQQVGAQAAQNAALATGIANKVRGQYALAELQRQSALAKSRYDQQIAQIKANSQSQQQLSFSMIQQLASNNIDPTPFLNNPIAAAVALGRIRYARQGETGLTGPQLAAFAEAGIDPTTYPSMDAAWIALGQARAQANQLDPNVVAALAPALQEYLKQQGGANSGRLVPGGR